MSLQDQLRFNAWLALHPYVALLIPFVVGAAIYIVTIPFRKMAYRKLNDRSKSSELFRNISSKIIGLLFVVGAALMVFGFVMVLIHGHK